MRKLQQYEDYIKQSIILQDEGRWEEAYRLLWKMAMSERMDRITEREEMRVKVLNATAANLLLLSIIVVLVVLLASGR